MCKTLLHEAKLLIHAILDLRSKCRSRSLTLLVQKTHRGEREREEREREREREREGGREEGRDRDRQTDTQIVYKILRSI